MMARARSGVEVRLLLDGVGALQLPKRCFRALQLGGVQTAIFSPLFARKTQGPRNLRNHRKMVIADGARLWAGGRNLAAEYFSGVAGAAPWLDLSFDLHGAVAAAAASQFESDWVAAGGKPASGGIETAAVDRGAAASARAEAQFLPSGPDQSEDTRALLVDRRVLSCPRTHDRRDSLFRARHRLGNGHAPRGAARRKGRLVHPGELQSPPGGLCAQSLAALLESGRRQCAFAALYEPCESRGVRSRTRDRGLRES